MALAVTKQTTVTSPLAHRRVSSPYHGAWTRLGYRTPRARTWTSLVTLFAVGVALYGTVNYPSIIRNLNVSIEANRALMLLTPEDVVTSAIHVGWPLFPRSFS